MNNGFNPMRHDCDIDGCFNKTRRPKIEVFADCFPGLINFGDVDGLVERNGRFCLLEWKGDGGNLRRSQMISFEQFTATLGNIVFVVHGNAQTMEVASFLMFWAGRQHPIKRAPIGELKYHIGAWARWVETYKNPDICLGIRNV